VPRFELELNPPIYGIIKKDPASFNLKLIYKSKIVNKTYG